MVKFKGTKPKKSLMTELLFEGGFFLLSSLVRVIMIDGTQSKGEIPLKCLLNTKSLPRISTPRHNQPIGLSQLPKERNRIGAIRRFTVKY